MSDEGLREGWLANWLITERVTELGGSCIQLTQSDMSAHGLIVVKEITHTHTGALKLIGIRLLRFYTLTTGTCFPQKIISKNVLLLVVVLVFCDIQRHNNNNNNFFKFFNQFL